MSLINKMLQDLDARGGAREDGLQQRELKAVPAAGHERRPLLLAAGVGVALVAVVVAGWYGWQATQRNAPGPVPVMTMPTPAAAPTLTTAPAPAAAPMATAPALATDAAVAPAAAAAVAVPVASGVTAATEPAATAAAAAGVAAAAAVAPANSAAAVTAAASKRPAPVEAGKSGLSRAAGAPGAVGLTTGPELTPRQLSENTYRRALAALQEGRVSAAMADLEHALEVDPRNDAARQTYVSLLLENRRSDDAIGQLRQALAIDQRQPGLAMVLARLQLERGGPALDTLMTTLPYAAANADYQGLLAGVLQREQRHAEAVRYYQAALKLAPLNGVWWMGLGISLQADQHPAEAREAFTRARTGNGITPELLAFIERRLEQLSRAAAQ